MKRLSQFVVFAFLSAVLATASFAQPEAFTDGMVPWKAVKDFDIGSLIPICKGIDNEYPVVATDSKDNVWVAWARREGNGDRLYLNCYKDGNWGAERVVSEVGKVFWPILLCDTEDRLHILWSQEREGQWQIFYSTYFATGLRQPLALTEDMGANRRPAACFDSEGSLWVAWESDVDGNRDIFVGKVRSGEIKELACLTDSNAEDASVSIAADSKGGVWVAWHRYPGDGNFDIFVRERYRDEWQEEKRITAHPGVDAFPTIAVDGRRRLWIAWHSNRKGDTFDITNWVYLRCLAGDRLYEPAVQMPGKALAKHKTDQGFEFPNLHIDKSGRVWVFGRPSHNFCAQYYHGNSWSPLIRLPREGWGGRGQYVRVSEDSQGNLWLARRSLQYNSLQKLSNLASDFKNPKLKRVELSKMRPSVENEGESSEFEIQDSPYKVFIGDIHAHTWMSDGMSSIDEFWSGARDVRKWDFASLTDHEDFVGNRISPSEWSELTYLANRYNDPGNFVAIHGYEWTTARPPTGFGHKNVYFSQANPPLFGKKDPGSENSQDLYTQLRRTKALAFPHHIGWTGADWPNFDPEIESCVEVVSNHGAFEFMGNEPIRHRGGRPGDFIQNGLEKGFRFGIVGGSDSHGLQWHHLASYKRDCWRAGATAVLAKDLTRESVMDALRNRRCYATSGVRILLDFQADGHLMGEEYETSTPPKFSVRVIGSAPIYYMTLVRNNRDIYFNGADANEGKFTYTDDMVQPGVSFYYVRVLQRDGAMAWSSPIWVNYRP